MLFRKVLCQAVYTPSFEECSTRLHVGNGGMGVVHVVFSRENPGFWAEVTLLPYGEGIRAGRRGWSLTLHLGGAGAWEGQLLHWEWLTSWGSYLHRSLCTKGQSIDGAEPWNYTAAGSSDLPAAGKDLAILPCIVLLFVVPWVLSLQGTRLIFLCPLSPVGKCSLHSDCRCHLPAAFHQGLQQRDD